MPIVNPTPAAAPVEAPISQVQIAAPAFKGVMVDSKYEPAASLLTHVEGASWTVNYYQQVLGYDSQLSGQQVGLAAPMQQYRHIRGLELKVTTELTMSQNVEAGFMTATGSATVYPFMIPNVGDMFVSDVGDGKEGLFRISSSEKKTIFRDTCYQIEYQLIQFTDPQVIGDLTSKVVDRVQYVRDFVDHGQNPLLQESVFSATAKLVDMFRNILPRWLRDFTSTEYSTLLLPGQSRPVYDPFLTAAVMKLFSTTDDFGLAKIRVLNVDDDLAMRVPCLWDALLEQDESLVQTGFKKAASVGVVTFTKNPMLEGIRYSGVRSVIYPKDGTLAVDLPVGSVPKPYEETYLANPVAQDVLIDSADLIQNADLDTDGLESVLVHPVSVDDWYVFSQAFYEKAATGQSLLELQLRRYLRGEALSGNALMALMLSSRTWGLLERFYYIPVLLTLVRAYVREL